MILKCCGKNCLNIKCFPYRQDKVLIAAQALSFAVMICSLWLYAFVAFVVACFFLLVPLLVVVRKWWFEAATVSSLVGLAMALYEAIDAGDVVEKQCYDYEDSNDESTKYKEDWWWCDTGKLRTLAVCVAIAAAILIVLEVYFIVKGFDSVQKSILDEAEPSDEIGDPVVPSAEEMLDDDEAPATKNQEEDSEVVIEA